MSKKHRIISASGAILAIAFALLLTGPLSAGEDDTKAEKAIQALGGKIVRSPDAPGRPIISVDFSKSKVTDADLKCLQSLGELRSLKLDDTRITDDGLLHVKDLTNLRRLTVSFTATSDEGLKHLTGLSHLEFLHVGYCAKVTAKGKANLRKALPKLEIFGP
jgi:hypothetical protein